MNRLVMVACGVALVSIATPAGASLSCRDEVAAVQANWNPNPYPGAKPFQPRARGEKDPHEVMISSMRLQLKKADELCKEGNDEEALLELNPVRTWLERHQN